MTDRTVRAKFLIDIQGAVASLGVLGAKIKDTAKAGTDFAAKNKSSFDGVATSLAGIGIAAAAGVGLAVKHFADFDKEMSNVKAATHETTGNMELLRAAALQAGKDTSFSAKEAAQGITNLAKAGISTTDILGGGLKGALDLAAAGQISVADASEVAATALTQFKLQGKDVPHIADLLAAGAGKAQGEVGDMAMALKQGGLVASQFGLSIEDTTGTLAAFASAGLIGSDAGTSFKTMLLALANPSKQSAKAMAALGINTYDAQGAFIGIAPLAEQLKTQLSGLTEEQRNAALAQIFGNDAIRAANVLYSQGAQGINDWVTKVNDAGFASETARTKTDNLAGDIERLGGAFDTALIQSGTGANSVLRGLAQGADAAVSGFANLPNAVTGVATALAAVAAIGGLGAAGTLKAATAAGQLRAQWQNLGRVGRTLTVSMGAVGVALVAAAAIYGVFAKRNAEAKQQVDDLRGTLDAQTGAITGNTRAYVSNQLAQSGLAQKAKDFGLSLSQVTDAALGNQTALDGVVTSLNAVIAAGTTQVSGGRSGTVTSFNDSAQAAKKLKDELLGMNGSLSDAQKEQALSAEGAKASTGATTDQAKATAAAAVALKVKEQADLNAANAAKKHKEEMQAEIAVMLEMPGLVLSLRDAQRNWFQSLDDVNKSLKDNGKTLDQTTQKGRDNQASLDGLAKSANDVTTSMLQSGRSNLSVVRTYEAQRAGLIATAQKFGLTRAAATAYATSVLAIPKRSNTTIQADITDLQSKLATAKRSLNDKNLTKARKAEIKANIAQLTAALRTAQAQLAAVPPSKTVTITTRQVTERIIRTQTTSGGGHAPGFAGGGSIPGFSPTPTADNVPIMATAGEFMHNVAAVNYYGTDIMDAMNNRRIPKSAIKGYATGGLVGGLDPFLLFSGQFAGAGNPVAGFNFAALLNTAKQQATLQARALAALKIQQQQRDRALAAQNRIDQQQKAGASRLATLRANGASDATIHAQQLKQIELTKQLNAAKAKTKKENADVTASEKAYANAAVRSKTASEAYKTAISKLNEVRQQAVDFASGVADQQLQGSKITDFGLAGDREGILGALQQKGADLATFATSLEALQKQGLSKDLLDQLRSAGPQSSGLAREILAGGSAFIGQLNKAELTLQGQAGRIGAGAALQQFSVTNLTSNIIIGNEVVRVVKQVLAANNAALARATKQKTG